MDYTVWQVTFQSGQVRAYDESVYEFSHDLNPEYKYNALDHDPPSMKRKVIRGGSWKDIGYYLQTGTRSFEYQDSAKSYVGTRSVYVIPW